MYRLLSAHVLALIDDSVISIKRYIVVQHCRLPPPPFPPSSDPVSQCGDLYRGHSGRLCMSLTNCLLLGISVTAVDKGIRYSL